jgi:type IX secretion system substrate protein
MLLLGSLAISQPITYDWTVGMGGQTNNAETIDIVKDAQGNTYITGEFSDSKSFGPFTLTNGNGSSSSVFVAKYNASGVCQWAIKGGANFSSGKAGGITLSGGSLYVTGHFVNSINFGTGAVPSAGFTDVFLVKLSTVDGSADWLEKFGGPIIDECYSVGANSNGGVFITGKFSGTATFGAITLNSGNINNFDIFIAKVSDTGTTSWAVKAGNTLQEDRGYDVAESPNGDIIVTGYYYAPAIFGTVTVPGIPGSELFVASYDESNGNLNWISTGGSNGGDWGTGVGFDPNNNIYISGFIGDTATFGPFTVNSDANGNIFIGKFSPLGTPQWIKSNGSMSNDSGLDIITDFAGSSYVTGYVTANANFDGTPLTGIQLKDVFICKYTTTGLLRWVTRIGGPGFDTGKSLALDPNGKFTIAGEFFGTLNVGGTVVSAPPSDYAAFLTKMGGGTVGIAENEKLNILFYPNPTSSFITVELPDVPDALVTVEIIDMKGSVAVTKSVNIISSKTTANVDVSALPSGTYSLRIDTSEGIFNSTFVVN